MILLGVLTFFKLDTFLRWASVVLVSACYFLDILLGVLTFYKLDTSLRWMSDMLLCLNSLLMSQMPLKGGQLIAVSMVSVLERVDCKNIFTLSFLFVHVAFNTIKEISIERGHSETGPINKVLPFVDIC